MERKFDDMELQPTIEQLMRAFVQRRDLYALQLNDGRYFSVREPLRDSHIRLHLEGEITLGTYILDTESRARFMVFDSDRVKGLEELAVLSLALREKGIPTYLESSRRGGHLWFFFDEPLPGKTVRAFGKGIIEAHQLPEVETFPKQAWLGDGPGSMIKMPFGKHQKTGKRYPFVYPDGKFLAPTVREQIAILAQARTVPEKMIDAYTSIAPQEQSREYQATGDELWERVKKRTTAIEFIGAFVPLRKTGNGAIGKCPFHEDKHASFGINAKENYWHCFAGCGAGSIIDFWMKWRKIEFPQAVQELVDLLGVDR